MRSFGSLDLPLKTKCQSGYPGGRRCRRSLSPQRRIFSYLPAFCWLGSRPIGARTLPLFVTLMESRGAAPVRVTSGSSRTTSRRAPAPSGQTSTALGPAIHARDDFRSASVPAVEATSAGGRPRPVQQVQALGHVRQAIHLHCWSGLAGWNTCWRGPCVELDRHASRGGRSWPAESLAPRVVAGAPDGGPRRGVVNCDGSENGSEEATDSGCLSSEVEPG